MAKVSKYKQYQLDLLILIISIIVDIRQIFFNQLEIDLTLIF